MIRFQATITLLFCVSVAYSQQPQPTAAVPRLVRFSGSFRAANGLPAQTIESVTLTVYRDQTGEDALWHEIQNVAVDSDGHYSVLMGATHNEGMPLDLFTSGEPRWLGVQFNRPGEAEQTRVLLVSVPYALKAADAETLGGKPASAYLLAAPAVGTDTASTSGVAAVTPSTIKALKPKATPANNGQPNYIGKFTNTTDLVDSGMYEVNGNVGIATTNPLISLDARTGPFPQMGMAQTTDYLTFFASDQFGPAIYWDPAKDMRFGKGGSGLYNPFGFVEQMRIKSSNGNVGIGTQTPSSKLDVVGDINLSGNLKSAGSAVLQLGQLGANNIGLGRATLGLNTSGIFNTALGMNALQSNTTGNQNTATGFLSLGNNTTGVANTANGNSALSANTTGNYNTAHGDHALYNNTTGVDNTATGQGALFSNTVGQDNTANGYLALMNTTSNANANTAIGAFSLQSNTTGSANTADGYQALMNNTLGTGNTSMGIYALLSNTTGNYNTAIGFSALGDLTSGHYNLAIGDGAGFNVSSGSNNIEIGTAGTALDNNIIRIGSGQIAFFAAGVRGVTTNFNNAVPVLVDTQGQLGTVSSSRRFKEDIQDMGAASHDLMRLHPVTFRYKQPFADGTKPIQYGLIAEEVAEVYPDLVAHSADGQIETVKYQVLDSMLLNEVQRQQAEIRSLQQQINELKTALVSVSGATRASSVQ